MSAVGPRRRPRISARVIRTVLGVVWLLDGVLQLQPRLFGPTFALHVVAPSALGQPAVLSHVIDQVAHGISIQPALVNGLFAGVQLLIGIGLLMGETVRPALAVSIAWALGVWVMGEGVGGLLTGGALPLTGAPGAALFYAVIAVLVWPVSGPRSQQAATGSGPAGSAVAEGPLGPWAGRVVWATYWTGMGILWLLPSGRSSGAIPRAISGAGSGEPTWLVHLEASASRAVGASGSSLAVTAAVLSFAIGLGPLVFRRSGVFLVAGVALSLDYWVFGQAFGQVLTGSGTDPSTAPLVVLLALAVAPAPMLSAVRAPGERMAPGAPAAPIAAQLPVPRVLADSSVSG